MIFHQQHTGVFTGVCFFNTGIGVWDRTEDRKYSIEFIAEDYVGG